MKRILIATALLLASGAAAQTPGPFSSTGSTPPNTLFFNQLNSALAVKQDFPPPIFSTGANGVVPISPGGTGSFLRADGAWVPPTTLNVGSTPIAGGVTGRPVYDNGGVFGEYTAAGLTAYLNVFTPTLQGLVPSSGGGGAGFLRADGIWIAPPQSVSSVFSRTGVVVANSGDYTFSQIGGNIAVGQMNSGVGAGPTSFWRGDGSWQQLGSVPAITVGSTSISGGTNGRILFDNNGIVGEQAASSGSFLPALVSGNWYLPFGYSNLINNTGAHATTFIVCTPGIITTGIHVDTLGANVTTAGSSNTQLAIYSDALFTGQHLPNSLLINTGNIANNSTGAKSGAVTSTALSASTPYWFCHASNDSTVQFVGPATSEYSIAYIFGNTTLANIFQIGGNALPSVVYTGQVFGTWPATLGSGGTYTNLGAAVVFHIASVP